MTRCFPPGRMMHCRSLARGPARLYGRRMSKTLIVAGYGPGISSAVAEQFGKEDFAVALVARNAQRLAEGQKVLAGRGIRAEAFPADLGQPDAARAVVGKVRAKLGPISALHWNAYST